MFISSDHTKLAASLRKRECVAVQVEGSIVALSDVQADILSPADLYHSFFYFSLLWNYLGTTAIAYQQHASVWWRAQACDGFGGLQVM